MTKLTPEEQRELLVLRVQENFAMEGAMWDERILRQVGEESDWETLRQKPLTEARKQRMKELAWRAREEFTKHLREQFPDASAQVEEYIEEAEHQDGREYWDKFHGTEDVADDFREYLKAID